MIMLTTNIISVCREYVMLYTPIILWIPSLVIHQQWHKYHCWQVFNSQKYIITAALTKKPISTITKNDENGILSLLASNTSHFAQVHEKKFHHLKNVSNLCKTTLRKINLDGKIGQTDRKFRRICKNFTYHKNHCIVR